MRKNKFRIYDTNNKEYLDNEDYQISCDDGEIYQAVGVRFDSGLSAGIVLTYGLIAEEFTGLNDENSIDVHENDIVELDLNNLGIKRCIVKWHEHNLCWYFDNPKQNYFMEDIAYIQEHIKVVGNIHTIKA